MNIWTSENIMKYWDGTSSIAKGEWTKRNGENAISIQPNNFHDGNSIQIFKDEFLPNTQYVISLYIDADDVVYNGNNVSGGMSVTYTDGSVVHLSVIGSKTSPKGWQHQLLFTDPNKSVAYMSSYYYTSIPVYYRWDSFVIPSHESKLLSNGVFNISNLNNNSSASIQKGGIINANAFYEF